MNSWVFQGRRTAREKFQEPWNHCHPASIVGSSNLPTIFKTEVSFIIRDGLAFPLPRPEDDRQHYCSHEVEFICFSNFSFFHPIWDMFVGSIPHIRSSVCLVNGEEDDL